MTLPASCGQTTDTGLGDPGGSSVTGGSSSGQTSAVESTTSAGGDPTSGVGGATGSTSSSGGQSRECDQVVGDDAPVAVNETGIQNGLGGAASLHENAVCGCNGDAYEFIELIEGPLDPYKYCLVPAGQFGCGEQACTLGEQYCGALSDHSNASRIIGHECIELPESCAEAANLCDCLGASSCREVEVEGKLAVYVHSIVPH